jgi:GT2 family glycosyltransferase
MDRRAMSLTWSLIVPTLNRPDVLVRSLHANVRQTRPPRQVIVVDSSEGWQQTRDRVLAEVAPDAPAVEWIYLGSDVRSSTYQRNAGFERCTGDVVFFLDDDSFMYRDCAEQVMRVYEADAEEKVGGVCATLADRHEDAPASARTARRTSRNGLGSRLMKLAHRQWWQDRLCIPYDGEFHLYEVGGFASDVDPLPLFHGCRMTFRTKAVREAHGFEEMLIGPAYGEDSDLSYRVSRDRALVIATKAALVHEQVPVARPKRELNTALVLLNAIALYKLNRAEASPARRAYAFLFKRAAFEFLRDCVRPRRWIPYTLGVLRAARFVPTILSLEGEALRQEYIGIQRQVYELCR